MVDLGVYGVYVSLYYDSNKRLLFRKGDYMKKTILVIDDDPGVVSVLKRVLMSNGYDVLTAGDGKEGISVLSTSTPDLIILDLKMDGMSGVGFLKEISLSNGELPYPVLVLTAYASMNNFFSNIDIAGFMLKPCSEDALVTEIRKILNSVKAKPQEEEEPRYRLSLTSKQTVLIAEDDDEVLSRLSHAFTKQGYTIEKAGNGSEAIGKAILTQPDLLVIKELFSEMNGHAVSAALKNVPKTSNMPIILYDEEKYAALTGKDLVSGSNIAAYLTSNKTQEIIDAAGKALE